MKTLRTAWSAAASCAWNLNVCSHEGLDDLTLALGLGQAVELENLAVEKVRALPSYKIYIYQLSLDLGKFYDFPKIVRFWSCRNSCDCEKSCENVWGLCVPQCFSWIICGACVPQCFSWIAFRWHQLDPSNDAWVVLACLHQNGFQSVD